MRTIKELLIEMRENANHYIFSGLCSLNMSFFDREEYDVMKKYIKRNRPLTWYTIFSLGLNVYWWKPGNKKPRIKWLDKQIKKQEKLENI